MKNKELETETKKEDLIAKVLNTKLEKVLIPIAMGFLFYNSFVVQPLAQHGRESSFKQGIELTDKIYNVQGGNEALRYSSFNEFYKK